jgi:ADP-ribose pyrophosphatase
VFFVKQCGYRNNSKFKIHNSKLVYVVAMASKRKQAIQIISSRVTYRGPVFYVSSDDLVEPGGIKVHRDVVRHQGSVVILAVDENGLEPLVLLERQYRYATGDFLWELPAGRVDEGESELAGAKRELLEETGYAAGSWKRALFYYSSPGFLDETMTLYLARELRPGKAQPEADEQITTRFFPLSELVQKAVNGTLRDGKTIAGVLWLSALGSQLSAKSSKKQPRRPSAKT